MSGEQARAVATLLTSLAGRPLTTLEKMNAVKAFGISPSLEREWRQGIEDGERWVGK